LGFKNRSRISGGMKSTGAVSFGKRCGSVAQREASL
jgi:hypothetical protein